MLTACDDEPDMPPGTVDNDTPGKVNPENCIVAKEINRTQILRNLDLLGNRNYFCDFNDAGLLTRVYDSNDKTVASYEYPDEHTVVLNATGLREIYSIGQNGFATKCNSEGLVIKFGYDQRGYLIGIVSESGDWVEFDYENDNMVRGRFYDNCKTLIGSAEYAYANISNANFGYMPYGFCSYYGNDPMYYDAISSTLKYAYIAGLIGKPNKSLPDTMQYTDNSGNKYTYYFHNEYVTEPIIVSEARCVPHFYGWSEESTGFYSAPRLQPVSTVTVEFE